MRLPWSINNDLMYKVGDMIRYDDGSTALMLIETVLPNHGGAVRYYGTQCMGGVVGAYHNTCEQPSPEDIKKWAECEKWRKP